MKKYLSRSQSRFWSSEIPVGDPTGGVAYGERNDPVTLAFGAAASGGAAATAGLFGVGGAFSAMTTLGTLGTAFSVLGALNQGQQAKSAAEYNAAVANNNAIAAKQQAEAKAAAQQRKARLQIGSIRAGYGASGVGLEGTPMDVLEQSASMAELDRQNILYGGTLESQGYQATAGLELMRGDAAETGSYFSAGSALLSGAAKAGSFNTTGVAEDDLYFDDWNTGSNLKRTG